MSKNILIAQVGNGKYSFINYTKFARRNEDHTVYYVGDKESPQSASIESKFSFYAIYQKLLSSGQVDAILLVGTKTSSWVELCRNMYDVTLASGAKSVTSRAEMPADLSDIDKTFKYFGLKIEKIVTKRWDRNKNKEVEDVEERFEGIEKPETREGIERLLGKCLNGTEVKIVIQEFGILPEESELNFHVVQEALAQLIDAPREAGKSDEEIHLYLDISNGFRSFPVYLFLWTNYMAQMRPNRKILLFLYYGMFESKMKEDESGCGFVSDRQGSFVPMIRMNDATDIMQWTNAVAEFYSNGSVVQMTKLLREGSLKSVKIPCEGKEIPLSDLFERFGFAMNSNNLDLLLSTTSAIAEMKKYLGKPAEDISPSEALSAASVKEKSCGKLPEYVWNLLVHISEDFKCRFSALEDGAEMCDGLSVHREKDGRKRKEDRTVKYGRLSIQVANWYLQQGRIGDAATALQEGMITYVLELFPEECAKLLQKKDGSCDLKASDLSKRLFNFGIRNTIRKNVFDTRDLEGDGLGWLGGYKYISDSIRNPAMRLQYNVSGVKTEVSMEEAKKQVGKLVQEMLDGELDQQIRDRLEVLLNMVDYDIFISYRRNYEGNEDGVAIVKNLVNFLEKQDYLGKPLKDGKPQKFKVFCDVHDKGGLAGTAGEFTPEIRRAIRNSRYFLLILGPNVFNQSYTGSDEEVFYKEILTARERYFEKETFEICINGYETPTEEKMEEQNFPEEIKKVARKFQWIGGKNTWQKEDFEEPCIVGQRLIEEIQIHESRVEED